jgi:rhodanese-like protein
MEVRPMNLKSSWALLVLSALLACAGSAIAVQKTKRPPTPKSARLQSKDTSNQTKPELQPGEVERIAVEDLKAMIARKQPVIIIDARSPSSWESATSKIKGAIRMEQEEIPSRSKDLPRDREIVTYCS